MTDVVLTALITTIPLTLTAMATLVVSIRNGRKSDGIAEVGRSTAKSAEQIHGLVNSNTGRILMTSMVALRRLADVTKHPDDIKAAEVATEAYNSHQAQQNIVDRDASKPARINP